MPSARRVLCARFSHLGLVAAWRRHPELRGQAVVLVPAQSTPATAWRLPVLAASEAAQAAGVRAGQPLRQAQQLCPAAVFVDFDGGAVEPLRAAVLAALWAVVPAVELGDGEAYGDLSGRHARYPDELSWAAAAARALTDALHGETCFTGGPLSTRWEWGDTPHQAPAVGVAGSRFAAWTAAQRARPGRVRRIPPGGEAAFLAPLPVGLLPVEQASLTRLSALGIDRIGEVAALAPADLERQFGSDGLTLHRHACGEDGARISAHAAPRAMLERLVLDGQSGDLEVLRRCGHRLCAGLGERLQGQGLAAARLELVLEGDGREVAVARIPAVAAGSAEELWPEVLGLLGAATTSTRQDASLSDGDPLEITALRLAVTALVAAPARQVDLWRRGDAAGDTVVRTVARLGDRFGPRTVLRPRLADDPGDLPERRFLWEPPLIAGNGRTAAHGPGNGRVPRDHRTSTGSRS
jgi:DNA polymerase IV